jgi:hypothetical protein
VPSGGARARSGPPADPRSARSERRGDGWTDLPAKRTGRIPTWPLALKSKPEAALWRKLWVKPQAEMWARQGLEWQVANYVRTYLEASEMGASGSLKTVVLRMEDTLGLSLAGLAALRWRIPVDEVGQARAAAAEPTEEDRPAPVRRRRLPDARGSARCVAEQHARVPDGFLRAGRSSSRIGSSGARRTTTGCGRMRSGGRSAAAESGVHVPAVADRRLPQKTGKGPWAAGISLEAVGPVIFGGWAVGVTGTRARSMAAGAGGSTSTCRASRWGSGIRRR